MKRLTEWQRLADMDDEELARKAGCARTTISRAKRGETILGIETQLKIKDITEGAVTLSDWAVHFEKTAPQRKARRESPPENAEPERAST